MKPQQLIASTFVLGSIILGAVGQARAADLLRSWEVTPAVNDEYSRGYGDGHIAWLPNQIRGGKFIADGDVLFDEFDDGTARLYGDVVAANDANKQWTIDVWFDYSGVGAEGDGSRGPKKELLGFAYSGINSIVDTDEWYYYTIDETRSILSADKGAYAGQTLNLFDYSRGNYFAQIGYGANGKNTEFGLSTWFGYTGSQTSRGHSDFNLDLVARQIESETEENSTEVPEPTLGLLTLGLLGFASRSLKCKFS